MNTTTNTATTTQARRTGTAFTGDTATHAIWAVWHGNQWGSVWTAEVQIALDGDAQTAIAAVRHK